MILQVADMISCAQNEKKYNDIDDGDNRPFCAGQSSKSTLDYEVAFYRTGLYNIRKRINNSHRVVVNTAGNMGFSAMLADEHILIVPIDYHL
jgi:hypothetical protein